MNNSEVDVEDEGEEALLKALLLAAR